MNPQILRELLYLWGGVYPHLGRFLLDLYRRPKGDLLEVGPFSGGVGRVLCRRLPDFRVAISGFEGEPFRVVAGYLQGEVSRGELVLRPSPLDGIPFLDASFDLIFVRGAFFFLSPGLLQQIQRLLAPGGLALVGGGYGPQTPPEVISRIASRSKELNEALGRRRLPPQEIARRVEEAGIGEWQVLEEGGLWLLIQKKGEPHYPSLAEAMGVGRGDVVSLVGGGGKTTLMFSLARELSERGLRVVTTTTTKIFRPLPWQSPRVIVEPDPGRLLRRVEEALREGPVTVAAGELPSEGKLVGIGEDLVASLAERADCVIVEADGSKGRPLKAPAPHEPVVPGATTLFVVVVGADGLLKPLTGQWFFRPEIAARLLGMREGEPLPLEAVAELILHPQGLMKGRPPGARALVFVNKAETAQGLEAARGLAGLLSPKGMDVIPGRAFFHRGVVEVSRVSQTKNEEV